ncbi:hypothetical protein SAMN02990966_06241 [Rhodospirillales bacterium URHD0017]|nr:hypothetical protein SAMN02990966_06241 [Rhodospirillales bacterium URHD0017]
MIGTAYSIGGFVVSVIILLTLNYWRVSGPIQVPSPRPPGPEPAASLSYALRAQLVIREPQRAACGKAVRMNPKRGYALL